MRELPSTYLPTVGAQIAAGPPPVGFEIKIDYDPEVGALNYTYAVREGEDHVERGSGTLRYDARSETLHFEDSPEGLRRVQDDIPSDLEYSIGFEDRRFWQR